MFTGLISDVGEVLSSEERGSVRRLRIACSYPADSIALGASIACSGPCLTAVAVGEADGRTWFDVDAGAETLERTTLGGWRVGGRVNLERSLRLGDELGGHLVSGHVDGIARVARVTRLGETTRFDVEAPERLARFIAEKGSVALDGTSLTVNAVEGRSFSVLLIPHTLAVTTWGGTREGDGLNIEIDTMARYAARLAAGRRGTGPVSDRLPVLARYNAWANHRLYDAVERLPDAERRADRGAFFRSLVGTLNHLLVVDRLWMARFTGGTVPALKLDAILHDDLDALRAARGEEDTRIIGYVDGLDAAALRSTFAYSRRSSPGRFVAELGPALDHLFNHQTHHRGQCHAILTGLGKEAPALDLMGFYTEVGHGGLVRLA